MKRCKKCLIPENFPDVKFNDENICNYCIGNSSTNISNKSSEYQNKLEKYIKNFQGKNEYDCILLFSGGKDSTYLLEMLKNNYKLNILTITVDTGLFPKITKKNISQIVEFFDVDNITVTPDGSFLRKLYKFYILNSKKTYCTSVCGVCHLFIKSVGLNVASKQKIPIVFSGLTRHQCSTFEVPSDMISKSWIPNELYSTPFTAHDRSYFWDPKKSKNIPHLIHPLIALGPSEEGILMDKLRNLSFDSKKRFDPLKTNCHLMWLLIYLDLNNRGFNPYMYTISKMLRQGYIKKNKWFVIIKIGSFLLKHKIIKRNEIDEALNFLDISMDDLTDCDAYEDIVHSPTY